MFIPSYDNILLILFCLYQLENFIDSDWIFLNSVLLSWAIYPLNKEPLIWSQQKINGIPIADKLLIAAVILILTSKEVIANWETIPALIILLREIAVSGLREYLATIKVSVPVSKIAKLKTTLQLIALGILILSESGISVVPIILLGKIALWTAALLTLYTGYDYLKSGIKHL